MSIKNQPVISKSLVLRSRYTRDKLREEYIELVNVSLTLIAELDVRDQNGKIIETGYSFVNTVLTMERMSKDITEQIDIIGKDKWLKLKKIWKRLREIEIVDKELNLNR
jgi:hypothetical protein